MNSFFYILVGLAALAVLLSLFLGLWAMAREGEKNRQKSQKYMRARVILQGLALILFVLAVLAAR